jgi:hypothetical protein
MFALLAVVLCLMVGLSLASLMLPSHADWTEHRLLAGSVAIPCGLGVFSIVYFVWSLSSQSKASLIGVDVAVALALLGIALRQSGKTRPLLWVWREKAQPNHSWTSNTLTVGFGVALAAALYACIRWSITEPHGGGWDAIAIWNLHARFLFLGGPHWRDGFSKVIPFSHPDYPLLVPASVAHFWTYLGRDAEFVPASIAIAFTMSTVALLYSAVRILRGRTQALIAGLVLVSTPSFLKVGVSQLADIPLAFYVLASIVLLSLYDVRGGRLLLLLAGAMAGLGAWTKNEGLLFFCALIALRWVQIVRRKTSASIKRDLLPILVGAAPILLVLAYFKLSIAPPGDLFTSQQTMLEKIADPWRYWLIIRWFGKELFFFSGWRLIPLTVGLAIYAKLLGAEIAREQRSSISLAIFVLALTLAGYFGVYLITPYDLRWHLRFSLDRLFLQLWPSALLVFFMAVRTPEQWIAKRPVELPSEESVPLALDKAA